MCRVEFQRLEDGFTLSVRMDPEKVRARREAWEAFRTFLGKAEEAGLLPGSGLRRLLREMRRPQPTAE